MPALVVAGAILVPRPAHPAETPAVHTNQDYLEEVARTRAIETQDVMSVFGFVFGGLRDEVTVYPTENYFYFTFFHDGIEFAGNIRLDTLDRDKGVLHFAYFTAYNRWNEELVTEYRQLTADDGVTVEKVEALIYRVTYGERSVTFKLNDLRNVRPPTGTMSPDETYVGPVYDEAGIPLYLIYNKALKIFHYVLNESGPVAEIYTPSRVSDRILVGHRTGFAFYIDRFRNRKILIGVYQGNSLVNNYFDGPFDQLPDNFIEGDTFKKILEDAFPEIRGKIDRFGNAAGAQSRVLITPYMHYTSQYELTLFSDCATAAADDQAVYYKCFSIEEEDYGADDTGAGTGAETGTGDTGKTDKAAEPEKKE
ncbi:MAG: hypothetical protein ACR2PM_16385 [Hyphomicrobiales bacterium]